ncbi:MAG: hypothetical protein IPK17_38530 [Chloroflexi bacterium]|uniref:hypothetical protein n=1 Tax=Candidatus Flexifilum breve TaxID=3140694 RepID=UPI00313698AC|nr:hypothetical protein [Chloroflexota bacterium]
MSESTSLNVKAMIALPQTVILPMALVSRYGVERRLVIAKREVEVPGGVAQWLKSDVRYADWFDAPSEAQTEDEVPPPKLPTEGGEASTVEAWSAGWTVPALREYAAAHEVELTSDDRKDDVIRKLREAGLPETEAE